jgi:MSHA biogenesis protein MshO
MEAVTVGSVSNVANVSIMPLTSSDVYGANPAASVGFAGTSAADTNTINIIFSSAKVFPRTSPSQRFFLVGNPISFCVQTNGQLQRFSSYGNLAAQSSSLSGGAPLAEHLIQGNNSDPVFRYSAGTLTRNALLQIRFTLRAQNETFSIDHEVMLRNVP